MKKNMKIPLLVVGGVAMILAGFFGLRAYQNHQRLKANEAVVKKFTEALEKKDFTKIDELLLPDSISRNGYTKDTVTQKYANVFNGINADQIKTKDLSISKKSSDEYDFNFKLALTTGLGKLEDLNYKGVIKTDKSGQKIEWGPELVIPGLSGQDKISYQVDTAIRGEIHDRNDNGLAVNSELNQIGIVPKALGEGAVKQENIKKIAETFELTEKGIEAALAQSWVKPDLFVPLKILDTNPESLPTGISVQRITGRYYPLKEAAAQLIGYVGKVTADDLKKNADLGAESQIGRTGLEAAFDKKLRGVDGGSLAITTAEGKLKKTLQEKTKKDGETIKLTIDRTAQQSAYDALKDVAGSAVASDPATGDLLTLVSTPSFDPNKMTNGISQKDYDAYNNDPKLPFTSRFATRYAPGSTFKAVTAAIGLDAGTLNPATELTITGLKWQKDASWGDYFVTRVSDVSPVNLKTALIYSDNIYMAQETLKMGEKTFRAGLDKFIFGEKLDLPLVQEPAQISNEKSFNSEILLADTGYGQGQLLISPIQQSAMYSVLPNDGTLVYPRLVLDKKVKTKEQVIKSASAKMVAEDLKAVVSDPNGTAHNLASFGDLAAKTGTAEIKEKQDTKGQENSFLYAFNSNTKHYSLVTFVEDSAGGSMSAAVKSEPIIQYLQQTYQ